MGWLLVAAMAAFQVYDVLRRRDIVLETAEHRFASLARALSEQTASSLQAVDVVVRDTARDLQLNQSPPDGATERGTARAPAQPHPGRAADPRPARGRCGREDRCERYQLPGRADAADRAQPSRTRSLRLALRAWPSLGAFRLPGDAAWTIALSRRIDGPGQQFRGVSRGLSRSRLLPPLLCWRRSRSGQRRVAVPTRWAVAGALSRAALTTSVDLSPDQPCFESCWPRPKA